ncbi:MAG: hypothetical protein WCK34_02230 [Bacteroidota bacterium]
MEKHITPSGQTNPNLPGNTEPDQDKQVADLKFTDLGNRLQGTDKRIDDIKWFLGGITTVFGIVFSVLALIFNSNFNSEKESLREFRNDMKAELGKTIQPPLIELFTPDGKPLNGCSMPADFEKDSAKSVRVTLHFILKNSGSSPSLKINIKCYTTELIPLSNISTDEPNYRYESYIDTQHLNPGELPAHYSSEYYVWTYSGNVLPSGKYPVLLKIYYGVDRVAQAEFNIVR